MATLVLSTAGAALGGGMGGTVLGLSGAVIGRAVGATLGRAIDQRLLGGSEAVGTGRIDRLRLTGASEGAAIPRLWGRMRVAGQVIWASSFEEHSHRRRGGKGGGPKVTDYSYTISLAVGLCVGEILGIGRVWADGNEISPESMTLRLYVGSEDQLPDPKIEAVEGAGHAPAYRGLAYVVIEDLDLGRWGNRVPIFNFEVKRAAQGDFLAGEKTLADVVQAVALIPGTGEYALATTPVHVNRGIGRNVAVNSNTASRLTDFQTSLKQLGQELPNCRSVSLVVSWFGDDLRCGECQIQPMVEQKKEDGVGMPWRAGGIVRAQAAEVPRKADRPVYGGTPSDQSVVEAINAIRAAGHEVMFYPFILMTQLEGNALINPYTGDGGQPALPWRGRITTSRAPGIEGTTDRTATAAAEIAAFFGDVGKQHFSISGQQVNYSGPNDWGFRRFILHYAYLCKAAGGVDSFCIGSEMRGLTQIRGAGDSFPAVDALRILAAEVKAILGESCSVSYAADWTEYGSYVADGNVYFPLDTLWSDPAVDFVGIDNYMPLGDWRDGRDHLDADYRSATSIDYLTSNIAGGEGFDWYYDGPEGEAAQNRIPIEDSLHDEPWIFRVKDLRSWWSLPHHARAGAERADQPTKWIPMSKPIRFTEYGCAAIDKGANQPNRFLDLMSSESGLPRESTGQRDDLMQMQYLRAMAAFWDAPGNNPVSSLYEGRMLDFAHSHVWAWDARPFPAFPGRPDLWSDDEAYARGHWLNGRATNQPLSAVFREICGDVGVDAVDASRTAGVVRGYLQDQVASARSVLQPLLHYHAVDVVDRDGSLSFVTRRAGIDYHLHPEWLAITKGLDGGTEIVRAPESELAGTVRLGFVDSDGSYDTRSVEARYPDENLVSVTANEMSMVLTAAEGLAATHRWLAETHIARDGLRLALPPSMADVGPGDCVALPDGTTWRVDRAELAEARVIEAVRVEGGVYESIDFSEEKALLAPVSAPVPPYPIFLDLPLLTGDEEPHQPHLAVAADPWAGTITLWGKTADGGFEFNKLVERPSVIGQTITPLAWAPTAVWDRGPALRIQLSNGRLASVDELAVLNGANVMAIGDGSIDRWEIFQFSKAVLVAPDTYDLSLRLRGQLGTDGNMPESWPAGSIVVFLDGSAVQVDLPKSARGLARTYRISRTDLGYDDASMVERIEVFNGIGLRPYSVSHLCAKGRPGADINLGWIRRTRLEGDNWAQVEVPLGEDKEAYLLRVVSGGVIVREDELTVPCFDYRAAMQVGDGAGDSFMVEVAQLSSRFGPGPFSRILLET